ncbi:hypothetical protein [Achromobacter denitrificans]|uniref:Uncharacterized protein n=1 Tax=Achromobacter denitrificans TaxID=32002 RepID=A0ABZ3G761_ACHDE
MTNRAEFERLLDVYGFRCERFGQDLSTHARAQVVSAFAALASTPAAEDGLTAKQAWWAGYRAGKSLPPDTPRQDAVKVDISSARLVTHWPNGTPRDERDIARDPEGKLIHDPTEPLLAASAPVAGEDDHDAK